MRRAASAAPPASGAESATAFSMRTATSITSSCLWKRACSSTSSARVASGSSVSEEACAAASRWRWLGRSRRASSAARRISSAYSGTNGSSNASATDARRCGKKSRQRLRQRRAAAASLSSAMPSTRATSPSDRRAVKAAWRRRPDDDSADDAASTAWRRLACVRYSSSLAATPTSMGGGCGFCLRSVSMAAGDRCARTSASSSHSSRHPSRERIICSCDAPSTTDAVSVKCDQRPGNSSTSISLGRAVPPPPPMTASSSASTHPTLHTSTLAEYCPPTS
mmetsp:Transcript_1174/g.3769  ORF Transcript_1174/g.3769 Transcript_1174/m.3769 type:complete len:280 (-) Transcript_1174:1008-1847(-)